MKHCNICTCLFGEDHDIACEEICRRLKGQLKSSEVRSSNDAPLFTGPELSWSLYDGMETDSSLVKCARDFTVLGESANMYYRPQTVDTHTCFQCNIDINHFVQNDTLLGEHIYHVYDAGGQCPYLEDRFKDRRNELMSKLGEERYRKGSIALPAGITNAVTGTLQSVASTVVLSAAP